MNKYTELDKILHREFLGKSALSNFFYERLISKSKTCKFSLNKKHIFISGLARSGTTALLNKIFSTGEFGSLVYKYMPFILSPRLANYFSRLVNDNDSYYERFHRDGIKINNSSPECLDEIIWLRFDKNLREDFFQHSVLYEEDLKAYLYFLFKYSGINNNKNLVIKNNNNHIRIDSMAKEFKSCKFLILFRDPLNHCYSLLLQHLNFLNLQRKDPFILEYMNLIGHNEFGLGLKPFIYPNSSNKWYLKYDPLNIDYWIKQWIETYSWIIESKIMNFHNVHLVSYESLSEDVGFYKKLCKKLDIKNPNTGIDFHNSNKKDLTKKNFNKNLLRSSEDIYKILKENSFK